MVTVPTLGLCVPESCGQSDVAAVTTDGMYTLVYVLANDRK